LWFIFLFIFIVCNWEYFLIQWVTNLAFQSSVFFKCHFNYGSLLITWQLRQLLRLIHHQLVGASIKPLICRLVWKLQYVCHLQLEWNYTLTYTAMGVRKEILSLLQCIRMTNAIREIFL
jgi:hypothetical protein